jgi:hypothetical protein
VYSAGDAAEGGEAGEEGGESDDKPEDGATVAEGDRGDETKPESGKSPHWIRFSRQMLVQDDI